MKRLMVFWMVGILLLTGCANLDAPPKTPSDEAKGTEQASGYRLLSAQQAKAKMDAAENFVLLDVRTEEEFRERRLRGAMLLPDYEIESRAEQQLPDKQALIFIYCRSGRRSKNAAYALIEKGYTNVYDFGGINDWPYETVSGD